MNGVQDKLSAPSRPALRCRPPTISSSSVQRHVKLAAAWVTLRHSCRDRPSKAYYSSGWHLHQSLTDAKSGRNLFMPKSSGEQLSPLGKNYLGGLLHHALASTVLANPTINGYRRFRINSLAPDRVAWGYDHRGVMLRVLGGPDDPASRIENRVGEPPPTPIST